MHADQAGDFLEDIVFRWIGVAGRQHVAGTDIRMAGKRQLGARREDAHLGMMLWIVWWQNECRFR